MAPITALPLIKKEGKKRKAERTPQQKCEDKGGVWNAEKGVCILVKKEEKAPEVPQVTPKTPETFRNKQGNLSGISIDGRDFFGLSPDEVREIAAREELKKAQPAGTAPVGTAQAQAREQARLAAAVGQIGQVGELTEATEASVDIGQALTAGGARVLPGAVGGAAIGAGAGLVTAGALSIPAAIVVGAAGAVTGFVAGILGNIKEQQRGELQAADVELKNARTNMRQLAMLASQDPARAEVYIQQYNQQLTRVIQARRQTQVEVQGNLNSFMEDGREQLADFDSFLQPGGIADIYGQKLDVSLQTGVPLTEADLLGDFEALI